MNLIIAIDINGGIGLNGKLPWNIKEELQIFKEKTMGGDIIVGYNTSNGSNLTEKLKGRRVHVIHNLQELKDTIQKLEETQNLQNVWICGGKFVYEKVLTYYHDKVKQIHISIIKESYKVDTKINLDLLLNDWVIIGSEGFKEYKNFNHYVLEKTEGSENHCDKQYLKLLYKVLTRGNTRKTRNSITISSFCNHLSFDMNLGFPLLTTKKMFWKGILEEFIFFIKGETNSKLLEDRGIKIWKKNTSRNFLDSLGFYDREEGIMGPMYGYQWRFFNAKYDESTGKPINSFSGIDQLTNVINEIKTNPTSRRILMTDYNPEQVSQGVLPPCHSIIIQFYVNSQKLDMFCYNRSSDLFLGLPFNIASSALLLHLVAKITGLIPGMLHMSLGDCHIYDSHLEVVKEQLSLLRIPYKLPVLHIDLPKTNNPIEDLNTSNFELSSYGSHSVLRSDMIE
jgi:thymidylate synthase/dihydrofolate reductase